jgi:hypothetical protein
MESERILLCEQEISLNDFEIRPGSLYKRMKQVFEYFVPFDLWLPAFPFSWFHCHQNFNTIKHYLAPYLPVRYSAGIFELLGCCQ